MRVTVLGGSAAWPNPGQGCSSYLVESAGSSILLDCGPGTVPVLRAHIDFREIDGVFISHCHADHTLDLVPYRYGLKYAVGRSERRVPLHLPPGGTAFLKRVANAFAVGSESPDDFFEEQFAVSEYDPDKKTVVGPFTLTFHPTQHFIPCWAMRIDDGTHTLAYIADTGPYPPLVDFAHDSDLMLCEATYLEEPPGIDQQNLGHLTAQQAGNLAAQSNANRLLVTHTEAALGRDRLRSEAADAFGGPVDVAVPGLVIDL